MANESPAYKSVPKSVQDKMSSSGKLKQRARERQQAKPIDTKSSAFKSLPKSVQQRMTKKAQQKALSPNDIRLMQRQIARRKIGTITRIRVRYVPDPISRRFNKVLVYEGPKGKYAFPEKSLSFTGRTKFGGLASKELPITPSKRKAIQRRRTKEATKRIEKTLQKQYETQFTKKQKQAIKKQLLTLSPSDRALLTIQAGKAGVPKPIIERALDKYFTNISKKIEQSEDVGQYIKQQRRLGEKLTKNEEAALIAAGFQLIGLRALRGFTTPFYRPVQTVKGIGTFLKDVGISIVHLKPKGTVIMAIDEFARDPVGTAVEMYATQKAFSATGTVLKSTIGKTKLAKGASAYGTRLVNKLKLNVKKMPNVKAVAKLKKAITKLEKSIKKGLFKNKAVRKIYEIYGKRKLRTVPKSRRKQFLKEMKRRAKKEPSAKELSKLIKKKKALSLEKKRMALRKQQSIEKKIAQGKSIKAERPTPTSKGYFFKDKITGKELFFKSRKQWLRAVKQQVKALQKGDLISNTAKYIKQIRKYKNTLSNKVSISKNLNKLDSTIKTAIKKAKNPKIKKKLTQTKKTIEKTIESNQQQGQVLILKKAKPIQKQATILKQKIKTKPKIAAKQIGKTVIQLKKLINLAKTLNLSKLATRFSLLASVLVKQKQKANQALKIPKVSLRMPTVRVKLKQLQDLKLDLRQAISQAQSQGLGQSQAVSQGVTQAQAISQAQSQLQSQAITSGTTKQITKLITQTKEIITKIPRILTWKTKLPKGVKPLVNPIVRVRGKNKELRWKLPVNKATKRIRNLIDRTTTRSFQLKIVGLTKAKDIAKPSLKKFRYRVGKDKRVLIFVEKSKYAIDTKGEKKGLSIARLLKKRRPKKKKR